MSIKGVTVRGNNRGQSAVQRQYETLASCSCRSVEVKPHLYCLDFITM